MATEPLDEELDPSQEPTTAPAPKGRRSLARVRRELSEDELGSPAVQRLLVEELERLERQNVVLGDYRDRFHDADKQTAVLREQAKKSVGGEIVFGVTLAVGAAIIGYAPALWNSQPSGWIAIAFGALLMIGGIMSRVMQR